MPDDPQPNQSGNDPGPDAAEQDIDGLIASASSLAADLAADVGQDPAPDDPPAQATDPDADVGAQFDRIDSLLAEASDELGEEVPEPDRAGSPTADAQDAAPPEPAQPEPVQDATAVPAANPPDASAGSAEPGPDLLADSMEDFSDLDDLPSFDDDSEPEHEVSAQDAPPAGTKSAPSVSTSTQVDHSPGSGLKVITLAVGILDLIDRPFAWIGYGPRLVIGWIALFTLLAACAVFAYATWG